MAVRPRSPASGTVERGAASGQPYRSARTWPKRVTFWALWTRGPAPATPVAPDGLQPMLLPHRCPSCKIPQDRRTFCCSCNRRRKLRWCLCCGRETTKSCRWYCRKGSCPRPALQEREDLAREGYLSGPVDPEARPRLEEALGMVRQWVSGHTLSNGHPKKAVLLHHVPNQDPGTLVTRYVLKPPPGDQLG